MFCYSDLSTRYWLDVKRLYLSKISTLQVQQLISELNEILAHDVVDKEGIWIKKVFGKKHMHGSIFINFSLLLKFTIYTQTHTNITSIIKT